MTPEALRNRILSLQQEETRQQANLFVIRGAIQESSFWLKQLEELSLETLKTALGADSLEVTE